MSTERNPNSVDHEADIVDQLRLVASAYALPIGPLDFTAESRVCAEAVVEIERLRGLLGVNLLDLLATQATDIERLTKALEQSGCSHPSLATSESEIERLRAQVEELREEWSPGEELDAYMLGVLSRAQHEAANERRPDYMLALEWVMDGWRPPDDPERRRMEIIAQAISDAIDAEAVPDGE